MPRKTRSDSKIEQLIDEHGDQHRTLIFEACEHRSCKAGVAWLRAEYGLEISENRLGKWLENERIDRGWVETLNDVSADRERASMLTRAVGDAAEFTPAIMGMLGQALFETMRSKDAKQMSAAAGRFAMVMEAVAKDRKSKADVQNADTNARKLAAAEKKIELMEAQRREAQAAVSKLRGPNLSDTERKAIVDHVDSVLGLKK